LAGQAAGVVGRPGRRRGQRARAARVDTDGDLDRLRRIDAAAAELRQLVHAVMPAALCLTAFASAAMATPFGGPQLHSMTVHAAEVLP
jgi:hypothetical protein